MSLVITRKHDDKLIIVSDTKLSTAWVDKDPSNFKNLAPQDGTIKSVLISSSMAICYAGMVGFAESALQLVKDNDSRDDVLKILEKVHNESNKETEFILAIGGENPELVVLKNGETETVETAWIGSSDGFKLFQQHYLSTETAEDFDGVSMKVRAMPSSDDEQFRDTYQKMFNAMVAVIESHEVNEVGGFIIPLVYEESYFSYKIYVNVFRKPIDLDSEVPEKGWSTIKFGTAEDGSYTVNFTEGNNHLVIIHFYQGKLGIVYQRKNHGLLTPVMYPDKDEIDFSEFIKNEFDSSLSFKLAHDYATYAMKGQDSYLEKNYGQALEFLNTSITIAGKSWGPDPDKQSEYKSLSECLEKKSSIEIPHEQIENLVKIFILRGKVHAAMSEFDKSVIDFNDALSINKESFEALQLKGVSLAHQKKYDEAIIALTKCIEKHNSSDSYYSRGAVYFHTGKLVAAEQDFKTALELNNQHADAINGLRNVALQPS